MKKSELKKIIKEVIKHQLNEMNIDITCNCGPGIPNCGGTFSPPDNVDCSCCRCPDPDVTPTIDFKDKI